MTALSIAYDLANFGAAGLMGAMWLWERKLSRKREMELSEAHGRIMRDEQRLSMLVQAVEHNTDAVARFTETQRQVAETLKNVVKEIHQALNGNGMKLFIDGNEPCKSNRCHILAIITILIIQRFRNDDGFILN